MPESCPTLACGPYYGGADGFENVLNVLEDACEGLIDSLAGEA